MFETEVEETKTHILCSTTLFPKIVPFMRYVEKCWRARQATDDNTAHAHCMLDTLSMSYLLLPLQQWLHERAQCLYVLSVYCYNRDGEFTAWYLYVTVRHIHERKKLVTLCFIRVLPTDWAVWLDRQMMHCTVHAAIDKALWVTEPSLNFVCVMFSVGQSVQFVSGVTVTKSVTSVV
jgi:hypothetical protein